MAEEAGMDLGQDPELDDTNPDAEATLDEETNDIERNVNEAFAAENNIQETGEVSGQGDIPPPDEGESMSDYINRLMNISKESQDNVQVADASKRYNAKPTQQYNGTNSNINDRVNFYHDPHKLHPIYRQDEE